MYPRALTLPQRTFFLFGPRGTGKTTWLHHGVPGAAWFDLLDLRLVLELSRRPEAFRMRVEALPPGSWVVVDEIQKLPELLDAVHSLLFAHADEYRFALTGSSARKLKRAEVNLLAGRAVNRWMLPLTAGEMGFEREVEDLLTFGALPAVCTAASAQERVDILDAYKANYVREEIKQEAVVRNLSSFVRFLDVVAVANGQVVNLAGIARDAAVARPTVQGYFEVLVDTLLGAWLPAYRPRAKVKEVQHRKFYLFDCGVARALAGRLHERPADAERGPLLETWVLHELRAHLAYARCGGELTYWRTPSGSEIDFVWSRGDRAVGIEVKAARRWRREYGRSLAELERLDHLRSCFGVYLGHEVLRDGPIQVLPALEFARWLAQGRIVG
ncbi:MAG: ATP-binding protein [Deltaproteobacteria bacterium]|nr:ATP-binding protein [Deltaproteobacteria bacterium]